MIVTLRSLKLHQEEEGKRAATSTFNSSCSTQLEAAAKWIAVQDWNFRTMNSSQYVFFAGGLQSSEASKDVTVFLPLLFTVVCLIGFAGNLLVIAILIHDFRKGKSSAVNVLVIHLCSTDLLLLLFCIPVRIVTYAKQSWVLGGFACRTADWFLHSCLIVKSFTLAAIGQARYKHVVTPPKFLSLNKKHLVGLLFFVWSLAFLLPLPHLIFTQTERNPNGIFCSFEVPPYASNFMDVFSKTYPLLVYVLPMCFTFSCYVRALRRRKERRNRVPNPRQLSRKITSMLLSVSLTFEAMWLPDWIVWIWARHSPFGSLQPPTALMVLAQVIVFLNSTINPGIFLAVSDEFREGFKSVWPVLPCGLCRRHGSSPAGEKGAEMVTSTIRSLQDLQPVPEASGLKEEKILPDVEHFWQDRRNTTAGEENDPMPWEHQEKP
ncbi:probable G-protein coupled receptor 151 [Rhinatrema bivittatum]|uniref:probable G-protein coupled receptor 151 n=1 Tax=Rhinatrema bivittatum TaxID=194408 RepID=UPI001128C975|nr:probable G-protein coupled receptor 151 [Rhinatrema bivittatum]